MLKCIFIVGIVLTSIRVCLADTVLDKMGEHFLLSTFKDATYFSFSRSKHNEGHVNLKSYDLTLYREWAPYARLETIIDIAVNKDDLGVYQLRSRQADVRLFQHFKMSDYLEIGAGFVYSSETRYRADEQELLIPAKQTWSVNSRFQGWRNGHQIEVELARSQWQRNNRQLEWFQENRHEQQFNIIYSASF